MAILSFDPYDALGVPINADAASIKKAYRARAKYYHPDLNPNDPYAAEQMRKINVAYGVLSNPLKRAEYNRKQKAERTRPSPPEPPFDFSQYRSYYRPPSPPQSSYKQPRDNPFSSGHRHERDYSPIFFLLMIALALGLVYRSGIKSYFAEKKYDRIIVTITNEWKAYRNAPTPAAASGRWTNPAEEFGPATAKYRGHKKHREKEAKQPSGPQVASP